MSVLSKPYMHDEAEAFKHVEAMIWADGIVCPECGNCGKIYELNGVRSKPSKKNPEGVERYGLKKCAECKKQFTVRSGTLFEESHLPLHKWLQAIYLMTSSKKGISAHQLHRVLKITYKSAWFLAHRIREAMRDDNTVDFGSGGGVVEVDETFIGYEFKKAEGARGYAHKNKLLTLVDRTTGQAKSIVVKDLKVSTLMPILYENIAKEAIVYTDEAGQYGKLGQEFAEHDFTTHSKGNYVCGNVHTNTVKGYFSIFKRGMKGVYQHCGKQHLHRYAAEYEFCYNNRIANGVDDQSRANLALFGFKGKRILYRDSSLA